MNPYTGDYVTLDPDLPDGVARAAAALGLGPAEMVRVEATADQVAELSRRVRLGATEVERRRARRKSQAASRRRNR